jgi:hypothetical protein
MVDDLPTGYYHDNFVYLINYVREHYDDLLSAAEKDFHHQFSKSCLETQRLYVRLISRKGPYLRSDKLSYDEIPDIAQALDQLVGLGFVARNHDVPVEGWLNLATKTELLNNFEFSHKNARKARLCEVIAESIPPIQIQASLDFDLVEPLHQDILAVYRLLFFGNLYQDLTDFVLRDLGITPFEDYPLDPAGRYFDQRQTLEHMLTAYELQEQAYGVIESPDQSLADFARCHLMNLESFDTQLNTRHSKILNRVARQLERESESELAHALYGQSSLAPSRERRTRLFVSMGMPEETMAACEEIIAGPLSEEEYEFGVSFANRLIKQTSLKQNGIPAKPRDSYSVESLCIPQVVDQRVEITAAEWLQHNTIGENGDAVQELAEVWYVENGLLPGLFGLYFWDIIFYPVRGAFFNPFQRGPADLFHGEFYEQRSQFIEARFASMIDSTEMLEQLLQTFNEKYGTANHFVSWRALSIERLTLSMERIPIVHLEAIFRRLLRDLKHNRSGFPDLIRFPIDSGYEMLEVKGPGDNLQANQKRWLRFFHATQIPARVVNVAWQL